jgi:hypothetical protein
VEAIDVRTWIADLRHEASTLENVPELEGRMFGSVR